jgi:hypothetical protein
LVAACYKDAPKTHWFIALKPPVSSATTMKDANIVTPEPPSDERKPEIKGVVLEYGEEPISPSSQRGKDGATALKNVLDVFGKLVLGFGGLCYVLGVVVLTIHLRQYGVNSPDLPQLRYITAGVWVVLPIAFITTFIIFGIFLVGAQTEETKINRSWLEKIYMAVSTVLVMMIIVSFFWAAIGIEFTWKGVVWIPSLGVLAMPIIVVGSFSLKSLTRTTPVGKILRSLGVLFVGIGLFAAYVHYFATYTYKLIPGATGGGRASSVRLFITPESMPYLQGLKVALVTSQQNGMIQTDSVKLLLTTEKQFVVINAEGKAVSLPSDLVKGIAYEK